MLALELTRPSNLLVLDEPTNDLDIETLDLLQELLSDYPGTVLLVSHDRDFIDKVVTSVVVAEGGGRWVEYAGGYTDMLAQRGGGFVVASAAPQKKAAPKPVDDGRPKPKRKLSFNEQTALATLPKRIEEIQQQLGGNRKISGRRGRSRPRSPRLHAGFAPPRRLASRVGGGGRRMVAIGVASRGDGKLKVLVVIRASDAVFRER